MPYLYLGPGRPYVLISRHQLIQFLHEGYSAKQVAEQLKCSTSVVYKRLYQEGLKCRDRYSDIDDETLIQEMQEIHKRFPNAGCEVLHCKQKLTCLLFLNIFLDDVWLFESSWYYCAKSTC